MGQGVTAAGAARPALSPYISITYVKSSGKFHTIQKYIYVFVVSV